MLLGNGDGTFVHHATHPTGSGMQIGDFDKDGRPDLATGGIYVFLNQGPFTMMFEEDTVTLGWPLVDRAESYDVYRGNLSELADEAGDGAADDGYGTCHTDLDDDPTGNSYVDEEVPGEGRGFFYLRTGVGNLLAVDLGASSSGVLREPAEACP